MVGAAVFTIGIIISCSAVNVTQLIAGRVINGMANGCCAMMVPLWQSEVTPKEIRGRIISLQQCVINFGILSAFLIQYGCSFINSQAAWRTPLGLQMVPTIGLFVVMYFLPESPRWLMKKGRDAEALATLARVHANGDEEDEYVLEEYAEIKDKVTWESEVKKPSYFAILFSRKYARRTWIGLGAQFWQQAVGINSILYYAPFLFQQAGQSSTSASLLSNVIDGVVLNVVTWPNMYYLDTWGRRKPMIFGALAMGICMLLIGVLLKAEGSPSYDAVTHKTNFSFKTNLPAGRAVIAFLYLYVASFAISWATPAVSSPSSIVSIQFLGTFRKSISQTPIIFVSSRTYILEKTITDYSKRAVGRPGRDLSDDYSRSRQQHDDSYQLVCKLLVRIVHTHGTQQDQLGAVHHLRCHLLRGSNLVLCNAG